MRHDIGIADVAVEQGTCAARVAIYVRLYCVEGPKHMMAATTASIQIAGNFFSRSRFSRLPFQIG
jgi:hypothetical protein